jgi:hypothetical protein
MSVYIEIWNETTDTHTQYGISENALHMFITQNLGCNEWPGLFWNSHGNKTETFSRALDLMTWSCERSSVMICHSMAIELESVPLNVFPVYGPHSSLLCTLSYTTHCLRLRPHFSPRSFTGNANIIWRVNEQQIYISTRSHLATGGGGEALRMLLSAQAARHPTPGWFCVLPVS